MADAIQIDAKLFQERISHFINAWKNDRRTGDALFGGVSSIVIMMGKVEEAPSFNKNNAMHVRIGPFVPVCWIESSRRIAWHHALPWLICLSLLVLAAGLRIPYYPDGIHPRHPLHCYHRQER